MLTYTRCATLEEVLKLKQSELMHIDRDTEKLRFLIGMRLPLNERMLTYADLC